MRESVLQRRPGRGDAGSEGFTLIELLIVMLILGVLAATVVYAVQGITGNSVEAACGYDLKTVETAVEAYKGEMGNYPMGGAPEVSGATDSWGPTDNAAASLQAPLMNQSNAGPNKEANLISPAGPWLKDVPQNGTHYYIWVANDGSGKVMVGTGSDTEAEPSAGATDCSAANLT